MLINHTTSKKHLKRSIRRQLFSIESYTRSGCSSLHTYINSYVNENYKQKMSAKFQKQGDGGRQLVFGGYDLPIHHLVVD